METLVVKPSAQSLYTVTPQNAHPRMSLRRVLYVKFLRWVDSASPRALRRAVMSLLTTLGIILLFIAPQVLLGILFHAATWHHFGLVKILLVVGAVTYWSSMQRLCRRLLRRRAGANQHTYHGLPIDDLASYLCEERSFKVEHAMRHFGISQDKHAAIAKDLQRHAILVRGENNARVLNQITREELVRQLRDKFPLTWSEPDQVWAVRGGKFERWTMEKDRREQEEKERVEKLERKKAKLKGEIAELKTPFHQAFELMA